MKIVAIVSVALLLSLGALAGEEFKHGPDSEYHEGVPKGKVEQQPKWLSKIFPGTERDWWIYVPAQYDPAAPANVMVFQDGGGLVSATGEMRVPVVFDNLIHKKELPVTIGIFINPGVLPSTDMSTIEVEIPGKDGAPAKKEKRPVKQPRQNRSFEYDSMGDRYARFLIEEILPEVEKKYKLTQDPAGRALCGQSSGGSCAFTAAWERPDVFGKVVSGIGSFTSIHGCNAYPDLIRKMEPKPIRIYMQDGDHDLDIFAGSWWHANMDMAAAFRFMGYDYFFLQGHDGHSGKQLGVNFPDAMRWLWRNEPVAGKRPEKLDPRGVFEVLIQGEGWKKVADVTDPEIGGTSDSKGNFYFVRWDDIRKKSVVMKMDVGGKPEEYFADEGLIKSITFGPDEKLYAIERPGISRLDSNGAEVLYKAENHEIINHLGITNGGDIYFSFSNSRPKDNPIGMAVCGFSRLNEKRERTNFIVGGSKVYAMIFTPDQGFVAGYNPDDVTIHSLRVEKDGSFSSEEPFYTLQTLEGQTRVGALTAAADDKGRLYFSSPLGIQIFDQGGRVIGILNCPQNLNVFGMVFGMAFGGPNFDTLYTVTRMGIFARKLNVRGVRSCDKPVVVPGPRM